MCVLYYKNGPINTVVAATPRLIVKLFFNMPVRTLLTPGLF